MKFILSQDFIPYLWYLGNVLEWSDFSLGQAAVEGWLLGTDISCSLWSSYFPPLLFRNAFLQNGTVQWGVLPRASCCNLHLDFSLLNQHILPIVWELPSLWSTAAETHQFQPAPGLWTAEATPFPVLFPCSQSPGFLNGQAGGMPGRKGSCDFWLWLLCRTRGASWGRTGPPWEGDVDSSTVIP